MAASLSRNTPATPAPTSAPQPSSTAEGESVGGTAPPTDVDTTGKKEPKEEPAADPPPVLAAPTPWHQSGFIQRTGGFLAGAALGHIPFGGAARDYFEEQGYISHGTDDARTGLGVGEIAGGISLSFNGLRLGAGGVAATSTGVGAPIGVPALALSGTMILGGVANIQSGIKLLLSTGSGGGGSGGTGPAAEGGPYSHLADHPSVGPGKNFTRNQKEKILSENKTRNGGVIRDDRTGETLVRPERHQSGVRPPSNEAQIDHVDPRSLGGPNSFRNAEVRSRANNIAKSNKVE